MKIYSIIITFIGLLAISLAGYLYIENNSSNKKISALEQENNEVKDNLVKSEKDLVSVQDDFDKMKTSLDAIKTYSMVFDEVTNSFIVAGDIKAASVDETKIELVNQEIDDITDPADRIQLEQNWNDFTTSNKVTDFRALVQTLALGIERNINNYELNSAD